MNLKDAGIYDLVNIFKGEATAAHAASQGGVINNVERLINIPAYQRPYRWKTDNIKKLFEDYDENNAEYFLGSAVTVEKKKSDGSVEFDVVDGQQRLTTLYLLNYIRFLLRREYTMQQLSKPYQPKASEYCTKLKDCYVNLVGKNAAPFDAILAKIEELIQNDTLDQNERVEQLISCYKKQLCIAEEKETPQETAEERIKLARTFLGAEQLCLKYSRPRYDTVLKNALCNVYLKNVPDTTSFELNSVIDIKEDEFEKNYYDAMSCILEEVWKRAKLRVNGEKASRMDICEKAIEYSDELIKNMSLCVVMTEDEKDANKLFEVLNDRALEVEDLELIKNHFYKEYCTKSTDDETEQDKRITELDELWADKIFNGNGDFKNKLISYLSAVYLTCDKDLVFKDDAKLKDAIEKGYSSKYYPMGGTKYNYNEILSDFNTYYAIKIIIDKFGLKAQKLNEVSLRAEQEEKSITYRTLHLLNALKLHAVIPALTNVIISSYANNKKLSDDGFEKDFEDFIVKLIDDKNHVNASFLKIHQCAYMLWVSALKGKDYEIPREIARRIIEKNGRVGFSGDEMDFRGGEIHDLDEQLDEWLNNWTFSNGKTFAVKVILLNLLLAQRIEGGYNTNSAKLKINGGLAYKLDPAKLQLDHLEANIIKPEYSDKYYLPSDSEKRQNDVNGYLGNFMILDATDNNQKNNVPMESAMDYYKSIEASWLVKDIKLMIGDAMYFDLIKHTPKEEFFIERTKRLKKYFKGLLNRRLIDQVIEISF